MKSRHSIAIPLGLLLATVAVPSALCAQTFIVDAANGPGTNFTSLPAAVAAAPDGATLLVLPGTYAGFTMTGKGLTVLGTGAVIQGSLIIDGTAPHQRVTLRGLSWSATPPTTVIGLDNCQGLVLLEEIVQPANPFVLGNYLYPVAVGIRANSCSQLCLRSCDIDCTVELQSCNAVIESCVVRGESHAAIYLRFAPFGNPPRDALRLVNTTAQICGNSSFFGGWGANLGLGNYVQGGSGIKIIGGSLRMLDGTIVAGMSGQTSGAYTIEAWSAALRIAPRVTLTGALGYPTQGPQSGSDVMPQLTGTGATAGGALTASTTTEDGDLVVLAVGLPGTPTTMPGFVDEFWLDPAVHVFFAIGVQQQAAPIAGSITVPNPSSFAGLPLIWHAACFGPVTGQQNTNPTISLVH